MPLFCLGRQIATFFRDLRIPLIMLIDGLNGFGPFGQGFIIVFIVGNHDNKMPNVSEEHLNLHVDLGPVGILEYKIARRTFGDVDLVDIGEFFLDELQAGVLEHAPTTVVHAKQNVAANASLMGFLQSVERIGVRRREIRDRMAQIAMLR